VADYAAKFDALCKRHSERDDRMRQVALVRAGHADQVFPGLFPDSAWAKPIVANLIDIAAKDMAEQVGVLPTITANGDSSLEESSRTNADKRTKIGNYLVAASRLASENITAADRFVTYGFVPYRVEPNFKERRAHIHVDPAVGAYWDMDRFGTIKVYATRYQRKAGDVAALFPEYATSIIGNGDGNSMVDVVRWYDAKATVMFLPGRSGLVLASVPNKIGRVPVALALRPSFDGEARGQFDDVLPVYAAKARLAYLTMKAVQKSVEAPLALPSDVNRLPVGPDAVIRSNTPEKIRRVPLEVPQYAFAENNILSDELKFGARFPEARAGTLDSSVVTGQGVKALMAGFDGQIKIAQMVLGESLADAVSIAMEIEEAYFGEREKDVTGTVNGMPFRLKYKPSRDIKGNYGVTAEYGLMAGLDPNRALVWALQARGDKLLSRSFVRRNLPVSLNASEEERMIDMEEMRDSLKAGVASLAAAIPQLAGTGQDPMPIISKLATVIAERKNGKPIEDAVAKAFAPPKPPPQPATDPNIPTGMEPGAAAGPQQPEIPGGPVQNEALPQQPPAMQQLLAGLTGKGTPVLAGRVVRQVPA
jgi:hypothetical protein